MFPLTSLRPAIAGGNIRPARVIAWSATVANQVAEATGVTLPICGIAKNHFKLGGVYEVAAVPYIAQVGEGVDYVGPGQIGEGISGAAITSASLPLVSDASGRVISLGTPVATGGATVNWIVGYPMDLAAAANEVVRVFVVQTIPIVT